MNCLRSVKCFYNVLGISSVYFITDAYFRKTGLERSEGISRDLEWFSEQGIIIPEPSTPGVSYAKYLEELAEKSAPLFLSHFYNIYFSHVAGGQVIERQVRTNSSGWDCLKFLCKSKEFWDEGGPI